MIVVLDANILIADFMLAGNQFQVFFAGLRQIGGEVHIPDVVMSEVKNRFREAVAEQRHIAQRALRRLEALGTVPRVEIHLPDSDEAHQQYAQYLIKVWKEHQVRAISIPKIEHGDIVARDLARRKPFGKPSGYRDFLIWESVRRLVLYRSGRVVFITNNTRDFLENGVLHADLARDFDANRSAAANLELITSLADFNTKYILPVLERASKLRQILRERGLPDLDLQDWVAANLDTVLTRDDLLLYGLGVESADIGSAGTPKLLSGLRVEVGEVYETDPNEYVVTADLTLPIRFNVSFDYADLKRSPRLEELFGDDSEPFTSASAEWQNELSVSGSFRISGDPPLIQYFEVEDIDAHWG